MGTPADQDDRDLLTHCFLKGRRRSRLSDEDRRVLEDSVTEIRTIPARTTFVTRGRRLAQSCLLLEGWINRYRDGRNGERQTVCLHVPGDFVDLHGFALERLDHDLATITPARVALVPHAALATIQVERPNLTRQLWFATLLDAAMHREWIFRIGRMSAAGRVAHLMCELQLRLAVIGLGDDGGFDFPLTQQDLGEACGLTNVHTNRVIASLRKGGLVTIGRHRVEIHDLAGLRRLAEFDPEYLYLDDYSAP